MRPIPHPTRNTRSGRRSGQSLVEFAITLPVTLLIVLFGLDFGRVFLGWVTLNNAVREAANFAAVNPNAWGPSPNAAAQAEYARLITSETAAINCAVPGTAPTPTFPSGKSVGSPAVVQITCNFSLITPLIGNIVGNPLAVSASAAFPIRSGAVNGVPVQSTAPMPTASPAVTIDPSAAPTATPAPVCVVPNLLGVPTNQATQPWRNAGFAASNLIFDPLAGGNNGNYTIGHQTESSGTSIACSSTMTVSP